MNFAFLIGALAAFVGCFGCMVALAECQNSSKLARYAIAFLVGIVITLLLGLLLGFLVGLFHHVG